MMLFSGAMGEDTATLPRRLAVTADDFGISEEINAGIIEAHREGIVTSTSLLVNAPATMQAVELARANPGLEVGLHLSVVEGRSLLGMNSSITGADSYFPPGPCLHADWRRFVFRMATGRIRLVELSAELELQAIRFEELIGPIPFANSTQHLHLFPGVSAKALALAERHRIPFLRAPRRFLVSGAGTARAGIGMGLHLLSNRLHAACRRKGIRAPDTCAGFAFSGRLNEAALEQMVRNAPAGLTEIMAHPGRDCPALRAALPDSYGAFDWAGDLAALLSPRVRAAAADAAAVFTGFAGAAGTRGAAA